MTLPIDGGEDPFAPVPLGPSAPTPPAVRVEGLERNGGPHLPLSFPEPIDDRTFTLVDPASGDVLECKKESGVVVRLRNLGSVKDWAKTALARIALAPCQELTPEQMSHMSHFELAAYHLSLAASSGGREAMTELFDRILGKPKQSSESVSISDTVDNILARETNPPSAPQYIGEAERAE